jgi:hypothetical protein
MAGLPAHVSYQSNSVEALMESASCGSELKFLHNGSATIFALAHNLCAFITADG